MRTSFSRRELYALGEMLGDSVTRKEGGRIIYGGGGGGGGRAAPTETTSTSYNTNIPEYAKPYVETMLQGTQKQLFQTKQTPSTIDPNTGQSVPGATEITGFQPYKAYGGTYDEQGKQLSYDPGKAVAGFQPMQEAAQRGIAGMQMPGEFGQAADVTRAGITSAMNNQYQPSQFGMMQAQAPNLQQFQMGPAQQVGTQDYTGQNVSQYMNPYMQNVVDIQQREAQRQADVAGTQRAGQATRSGAFGGSRAAIMDAEAARNLATQKGDIQAAGQNAAFQNAQQQFNAQQQANLQAQQANQGAGLQVGSQNLNALLGVQQFGAGQNLQSQLANQQAFQQAQQAREQSRQFGAGYGLQNLQAGMQGAQQLAGLGQAGLASQQGIYNLQNTIGGQQQGLEQQKINQAMTDYANAQQYPLMQLGTMSNMLRGLPMQAQTTNQYAAAPNQTTQAIGTAGAAASLYNALKAEGGVIKEKKMASGGITSVPSYDVGGEVYADLMKMGPEELQQQIKSSSSEKVKEMAKSLLKQKQMAGGGIVAFARGEKVAGDKAFEQSDYIGDPRDVMNMPENDTLYTKREQLNPPQGANAGYFLPKPTEGYRGPSGRDEAATITLPPGITPRHRPSNPPAPDAPAGITQAKPPEPTTGIGTLQAARNEAVTARDRPMNEIIAEKQAMYKEMGVGTPGAEQREKLMAERANAADEAERTKWMRAAKFFASWGSTPGPTLVAGMSAVREAVPDMINDAKEAKKIRMDIDKSIAGLDEATRLEKKGLVDEAAAIKLKEAEKVQALHVKIAEIQAQQELETSKGLRAEQHDYRMIGAQKEIEQLKSRSMRELEEMRIEAGKYDRGSRDAATNASVYATFTAKAASIEQRINDAMAKDAYQNALKDSKMDPSKSPNTANMVEAAKEYLRITDGNFERMRKDVERTQNYLEDKLGIPRPKADATTMSGEDKSAYEWAQKNPNDPRSKNILKQLGK
jgi:hypothetical protein